MLLIDIYTVNNQPELTTNTEQSKPKLPKSLTRVTTFSKILAMILFITLPFLGFYLGMRYYEVTQIKTDSNNLTNTIKPSSTTTVYCTDEVKRCPNGSYVSRDPSNNCKFRPCSVTTLSPAQNETANWKIYTETFDWFGSISVKYPSDWSVIKSNGSGHPNSATFSSMDNSSCVLLSVSSDQATLNEELKNGATDWDASKQDSTVIKSSNLIVNGQQAKERTVSRDNKEFMDGVVYLGKDSRFSTNTIYAYLSSCGIKEVNIFNSVFSGLTVTPK